MIELNQKYDRNQFLSFLQEAFLKDFQKDIRPVGIGSLNAISKANTLGTSPSLDLQVFEFEYAGSFNKRIALAKEAFQLMKQSATFQALAVFYSSENDDWRFSLMTANPKRNEKGNITVAYSNPRRYSFFLGPNAKVNTPTKFLVKKGMVVDFSDLKSRFSLEVVNKEFYKEISESFTKLVGGVRGEGRTKITYESLIKLPSVNDHSQTSIEFTVRLIGRLIFCWFLREKLSKSGSPLMPKDLLSLEAISRNSDYYHKILEPIFFEILNKPIKSRREPYSTDSFSLIPYLNGGLFSPHDDDFFSYNEGKRDQYHNTVVIPDSWIKEFFSILETYNFTIDENTSIDEELSIDPEMLGRIFENLLAEINPETGESARKSTGSYYTPRVIVDYMVDESLLLYLKQKTNINEEKLRAIISYDLSDDSSYPLSEDEKTELVDAIEKVKILDPACGSGAYPIGALQKIVFILQQIDPEGQIWFQKQLKSTSPEIRRVIEREFSHKNFDYIRKLGVIRENIYGIDIQPIATEIARLRCFLTLVVDERIDDNTENRGIEPLPNLDFKFVTANSLIGLPTSDIKNQLGLFEDTEGIRELREIRDMFFNASGSEREILKLQFMQTQKNMLQRLISENRRGHADLTTMLTTWDPFGHKTSLWFDPEWMFGIKDGFDILIENPPYGASIEDEQKTYLKERHKKIVERIPNSYLYFIGESYNLAKEKGVVCLILPNEFLFQIYMTKARRYFLENSTLAYAINLGEKVFDAIVPTCIISIVKFNQKEYSIPVADLRKSTLNELSEKLNTKTFSITSNTALLTSPNTIFSFNLEKAALINKLTTKFLPFDNYCDDIANGISTSCDEVYIVSKDIVESEKFEQQYVKKCIRGGQFNRYYCPHETYDRILYITDNFDQSTGKNIYDYLKNNKDLLINKSVEKRSGNRKWQILFRPRYQGLFDRTKILFRQTGDKIIACADDSVGYYCIDSVNVGLIKEKYVDDIYFFIGILNSKLVDFFYRQISQESGRVLAQVKPQRIKAIPIAIPSDENKIILDTFVREIMKIKQKNQNADTSDIENKIDEIVYKIYEISDKELNIIKNTDA